jgi:hypothetical protein
MKLSRPDTNRVDPIVASVIQHRLLAIVEEMGEAMLRTSYSQILNSSRDFSTAICGLDSRLIAQAEHVPIHVGALPYAARAVGEFFAGDIPPGDVFLLNDPYHGGNTGPNPLGDANDINEIKAEVREEPDDVRKKYGMSVPGCGRMPAVYAAEWAPHRAAVEAPRQTGRPSHSPEKSALDAASAGKKEVLGGEVGAADDGPAQNALGDFGLELDFRSGKLFIF